MGHLVGVSLYIFSLCSRQPRWNMCPQEETKGDRFSKELEEESGIQQKAQTVWERSFSLVRMEESDQMWMEELQ